MDSRHTINDFEVHENMGCFYNSYWIRLKSNKESFLTKFSGVQKWDHMKSDYRDFIFKSTEQAVDHINNFIRSQDK